ncbi:coil containing protein [Vibrio phage 1.215.B._10N.222.54.F7]|nr:coil containing protein [Vibrio phage 1.215.A._10N.222.54.F7]AUR96065.1 coil containing protein [Vibrio phage 1.215.B._10N.222.54.F7]
MKYLTDANLTLTAQEAIVINRKGYAVYNLCREFDLPPSIRAPIRGLQDSLGELVAGLEEGSPDAINAALSESLRQHARALERIQEQDPDGLQWLTLLLQKIGA